MEVFQSYTYVSRFFQLKKNENSKRILRHLTIAACSEWPLFNRTKRIINEQTNESTNEQTGKLASE